MGLCMGNRSQKKGHACVERERHSLGGREKGLASYAERRGSFSSSKKGKNIKVT